MTWMGWWTVWIALLLAVPAAAEGDEPRSRDDGNSCVSCHRRKQTWARFPAWTQDHFVLWYVGAHGRGGATCDRCHGGNPAASTKSKAHVGVFPAGDPRSTAHFKNLPKTCGSCHTEVARNFVRSDHYKALEDDRLAPSCTTCHGFMMEVQGGSAAMFERCAVCHEEGGVDPAIAARAQAAHEHEGRTRDAIRKARLTIELARQEGGDTAAAEQRLERSEKLFAQTGAWWHAFHLRPFDTELTVIEGTAEKAREEALRAIVKR